MEFCEILILYNVIEQNLLLKLLLKNLISMPHRIDNSPIILKISWKIITFKVGKNLYATMETENYYHFNELSSKALNKLLKTSLVFFSVYSPNEINASSSVNVCSTSLFKVSKSLPAAKWANIENQNSSHAFTDRRGWIK